MSQKSNRLYTFLEEQTGKPWKNNGDEKKESMKSEFYKFIDETLRAQEEKKQIVAARKLKMDELQKEYDFVKEYSTKGDVKFLYKITAVNKITGKVDAGVLLSKSHLDRVWSQRGGRGLCQAVVRIAFQELKKNKEKGKEKDKINSDPWVASLDNSSYPAAAGCSCYLNAARDENLYAYGHSEHVGSEESNRFCMSLLPSTPEDVKSQCGGHRSSGEGYSVGSISYTDRLLTEDERCWDDESRADWWRQVQNNLFRKKGLQKFDFEK
jgi:hypothetical protein